MNDIAQLAELYGDINQRFDAARVLIMGLDAPNEINRADADLLAQTFLVHTEVALTLGQCRLQFEQKIPNGRYRFEEQTVVSGDHGQLFLTKNEPAIHAYPEHDWDRDQSWARPFEDRDRA